MKLMWMGRSESAVTKLLEEVMAEDGEDNHQQQDLDLTFVPVARNRCSFSALEQSWPYHSFLIIVLLLNSPR